MTSVTAAEKASHSLSAYGLARSSVAGTPLNAEQLRKTHAYWRACNYLMLGMIYLQDNPLLKERLKVEHVKNRLLGHWGSSPGLAFIYIHLNRLIKKFDQDMIFMAGPGHGAPLFTESDEHTRRWWPGEFRLVHRATFGSQLKLELVCTRSEGADES